MLVYFGLCFQSEGKRGIKDELDSGLRNWVDVHLLRKTEEGVESAAFILAMVHWQYV